MGRRGRLHRQAVIEGIEKPFENPTQPRELLYRCSKCGLIMTKANVKKHFQKEHQMVVDDTQLPDQDETKRRFIWQPKLTTRHK